MKKIEFKQEFVVEKDLAVRNNREALIAEIVNATTETDKKKMAKRLALTANTLRWSDTDIHALLQKKNDPTVRNYTAFVWWSCKIKG